MSLNNNTSSNELNKDGTYAIYLRKSRADIASEKDGKIDTLKRHRVILFNLAKTMNIDTALNTFKFIVGYFDKDLA